MLIDSPVETAVPADHVNRARDFYADKLGLTPVSEFAGVQISDRTASAQPATHSPRVCSSWCVVVTVQERRSNGIHGRR